MVPTGEGIWHGLTDPPTAPRLALSLGAGLGGALLLARAPRHARRPVLALGLAALPAVPVVTGHLLPLLAFQGPVLVLVLAAVLAVVFVRLVGTARPDAAPPPPALLFVAGCAFFALLSTRLPGPVGPQGDEPQHLLLAHSLLTDGDLDLADEFAQRDYAAFFAGELEPHTSPSSPPGRAYSIHTPGLAALVLPAYAAFGYAGVRLWLCALAALAAVLVHHAARAVARDERLALAAWAVLVLTPPLPFYAMRVHPETIAVLGAAVFLATAVGPGGARAAGAATLAAAALPWMHPKLLPLGVLGLGLTLLRPNRWSVRLACLAALALSVAPLWAHVQAQFGPASLGGGLPVVELSPRLLPRGLLAVLFDRQFGLLSVAPVFALALPGAVALVRRRAREAVPSALVALLFLGLAGASAEWWGGDSPPARYVLPAVPGLAVLLAPALKAWPTASSALAGLGLGVVALASEAPRIVHDRADGASLLLRFLAPALDLSGAFPSFFDPGRAPVILAAALLAAGAAAWRWGARGLCAGLVLFAFASTAQRDRPWVDRRAATLDLLWAWQPGRVAGPQGAPDLASLALPLELTRAPWTLAPGERRSSRRMDVPPGRYRFEAAIEARVAPARVDVDLGATPLVFVEVELHDGRPAVSVPLLLPAGARGLALSAAGLEGRAELREARLVPEALVPRDVRGRLTWPVHAQAERYRVAAGRLRVTVRDRSAPEGEGFRLDGETGELVVDGPREARAEIRVLRPGPLPADALEWGSRTIALGPQAEVTLHLPLSEGQYLGPDAVVPVRMRAPGAWIRVGEAPR
ncbi:MAG TPA: hypothetical protein VMT87_05100 [Vicinamibacteria bacterium]|nr:hypothetical protein [Vicinamibacteria bacterium]